MILDWVALSSAKISVASFKAALNSSTTIGTTLFNCSSVIFFASSIAICNNDLSALISKLDIASSNLLTISDTSSNVISAASLFNNSLASLTTTCNFCHDSGE